MSDFSLTLVLHLKTSKIINGMAKVQIKSERITPFGGIFISIKRKEPDFNLVSLGLSLDVLIYIKGKVKHNNND